MAESLGVATLELEGDLTPLGKSLDQAKRKAHEGSKGIGASLKTGITKAAVPAAAALALIGVGAVKSIQAASDLSEQINKASVVFRGSEKTILAWGETTAESIGISNRAALEAAGTFGNMLVPMGIARKEAGKMSMSMVELAADMASFNNASPEETLDALRAGLAGETEPLRRFGVFLNEARIRQEAVNLGLVKGKEELDASAKAQATYSIILKDTTDAQGDFARTSDGLANQERILRAELEDTAAALGSELLPAATAVAGVLLSLVKLTGDNTGAFQLLVGGIVAFSAAILLANASIKIYGSSLLLATRATHGLRLAMALTPWGLVAVAVAGLVGWLITQKDESDEAADSMNRLRDAIKGYHDAISEGKAARGELEDANLRLDAANLAIRRSRQNLTKVEKDGKATTLELGEANLAYKQALRERERAADGVTQAESNISAAMNKASAQVTKATSEADTLAKTYRTKLSEAVGRAAATSRGLSKDQARVNVQLARQGLVALYADKLHELAKTAQSASPSLARTAREAALLAVAWGRVVSLPAAREFTARFNVITRVEEHRSSVFRNASGTRNFPGGLSLVGERGPELVHLPSGTRIDSAMRTRNMSASDVHFHFPNYVGDKSELLTAMRQAVGQYRRRNGADPF